jgi:DNA polymerase-3 subunit gamma/tau
MLSKSAFNALLKTLEEPPKHVIFILATTELSKLPETVVSRCQVFSFKKPSQKILKDVVLNISKKEGYTLEPSSADLIALLGEGSFRDTQGILEKVISASGDKKISVSEVEVITGAPKGELVNAFIAAVEEGNVEAGMKAVKKATDNNIDMKVFLKLVLRKLRFVLLLKYAPNMEGVIKNELSEADHLFLKELSKKPNLGITSTTLLEFLNVHDWVDHTSIPELPIELALIKLAEAKKIDKKTL